MRNYYLENTHMETSVKLKKESEDVLVDNSLYQKIIGSLRCICNTRCDICHSVGHVSIFMENPRLCHILETKTILRYITIEHEVPMPNQQNTRMKLRCMVTLIQIGVVIKMIGKAQVGTKELSR